MEKITLNQYSSFGDTAVFEPTLRSFTIPTLFTNNGRSINFKPTCPYKESERSVSNHTCSPQCAKCTIEKVQVYDDEGKPAIVNGQPLYCYKITTCGTTHYVKSITVSNGEWYSTR